MDYTDILLQIVAPASGVIICAAMYGAPLRQIQRVRAENKLGDVNAIPFPVTVATTSTWLVYSLLIRNMWIFGSNFPGLVMNVFFMLSVYPVCDVKTRDTINVLVAGTATFLSVMGGVTVFASLSASQAKLLWGLGANVLTISFFASPLSEVGEVLRTRSSAKLYLPQSAAIVANTTLWVAYGLAIEDLFVWVPNALGLVLGLAQVGLCLLLPGAPKNSLKKVAGAVP
eukprot:jgi/Botrbrau1/2372/Bobra.0395s0006.2